MIVSYANGTSISATVAPGCMMLVPWNCYDRQLVVTAFNFNGFVVATFPFFPIAQTGPISSWICLPVHGTTAAVQMSSPRK